MSSGPTTATGLRVSIEAAEHYLIHNYSAIVAGVRRRHFGRLAVAQMVPEAVIHEMYLRLHKNSVGWESEAHLLNWMRRSVRHILIDGIRRRQVRLGQSSVRSERSSPSTLVHPDFEPDLTVRDAMARMRLRHPRQAAVVSMRHLEGYTVGECAGKLGISTRTVKRDSVAGRDWLRREFAGLGS